MRAAVDCDAEVTRCVDVAMKTLGGFAVGKPLVIEERFPLSCSTGELREFLLESRKLACGWMGHYSGESMRELQQFRAAGKSTIAQAIWLGWLELFEQMGGEMKDARSGR